MNRPAAGRWPTLRNRFPYWALFAVCCSLPACDDTACDGGELCECGDGDPCYLNCNDDDCDLYCHNQPDCGGVCEDDCSLRCHDLEACSASCGKDCNIECHNAGACGAFCGENCTYECREVDRCGVRVGDGSTVTCRSVSSCEVECLGSCRVECDNTTGAGACNVECAGGDAPQQCAEGGIGCGGC